MDSAAAPAPVAFDEPTMLRAMTVLHGARRTPPGMRPALVTHLLNAGLVAYTDIGWTITAAGYRKLAAAEDTSRGGAYARSLVDQTGRVRDTEDPAQTAEAAANRKAVSARFRCNRLVSREGAA